MTNNQTFSCHDADACALGQLPCPTPDVCGCGAPCPVKDGTHQPAEALQQIAEPALQSLRERLQITRSNLGHGNHWVEVRATVVEEAIALHDRQAARIAELESQLAAVQQGVQPTDKELINFATEEEFLLFCDEEEFTQIARAVLHKFSTHPTQQGLDAFRALYDSVVHSIDEGLLTGKALEAIILVPAVDFFESAKQAYTKEPQSELELNSARWKHVTNEAGTGMVSLVRFASNGSPCTLIGSEANSFVDAAIAAKAKLGGVA